jgi:hypothetical protein
MAMFMVRRRTAALVSLSCPPDEKTARRLSKFTAARLRPVKAGYYNEECAARPRRLMTMESPAGRVARDAD